MIADAPPEGGMLGLHHALWLKDGELEQCPRCGWEGVPTYVRGVPQSYCPSCEGFGDEIDLREQDLAYPVHITRRGILTPGKPRAVAQPKVGRNDPCICGSGKKFKKCCEGS